MFSHLTNSSSLIPLGQDLCGMGGTGCCASRSEGAGPAEAIRAHSSSRNITAPSTRPGSLHSPHGSHGNFQPAVGRQDPVDRPNTPLTAIPMFQRAKLPNALASSTSARGRVPPLTDSTNQTWTPSRLEKERNDWWDTQVTGSPEVWGAIRLAAQSLQAGKLRDAQAWLETMECTCPTGCLWKGVYDSTGILYKVPEWLIVEPEGLVPEDATEQDAAQDGPATGLHAAHQVQHDDDDDGDGDEPVVVRFRLSRDGRDIVLNLTRKSPVHLIVDRIKAQAELDSWSRIRLAYGGRIYHDNETLESHVYWDFANDYIINALVVE
ncbi:hypothetical protein ACEQ8H_001752 [Pleosporales sp. CAS-2024a]